jgi:hypothetical protein
MAERYQIASTNSNGRLPDAKELARFLAKDKQMLLPMLDLIEQCGIDDVVDVTGLATIDAVLQIERGAGRRPRLTPRYIVRRGPAPFRPRPFRNKLRGPYLLSQTARTRTSSSLCRVSSASWLSRLTLRPMSPKASARQTHPS